MKTFSLHVYDTQQIISLFAHKKEKRMSFLFCFAVVVCWLLLLFFVVVFCFCFLFCFVCCFVLFGQVLV